MLRSMYLQWPMSTRRAVGSGMAPNVHHVSFLKDPFTYETSEGASPEADFAILYANCSSFSEKFRATFLVKIAERLFP